MLPEAVTTTLPPVSVKLKVSTPAGSGKAQTPAKAKVRREELSFMVCLGQEWRGWEVGSNGRESPAGRTVGKGTQVECHPPPPHLR